VFVRILAAAALIALLAPSASSAAGKLRVAASTNDLASIAASVGGDQVEVFAIARPTSDVHRVEVLPSYMVKVSKAQLYLEVGLKLDQWADGIIDGSRNSKLKVLDCSRGVTPLDKPASASAAGGDVHPFGNPHYWLDPRNGRLIARAVQDKLSALQPADAAYFAQQYAAFDQKLAAAEKRWDAALGPYKGTKIVTYHRSWPNFCDRFGLDVMGYVEPRPGIPPSPSHTLDLIRDMKAQGVKLILVEPYFDAKTPNSIARETGGQVLVMTPSVGGVKEATDYIALFDYDVKLLADALRQATGH